MRMLGTLIEATRALLTFDAPASICSLHQSLLCYACCCFSVLLVSRFLNTAQLRLLLLLSSSTQFALEIWW